MKATILLALMISIFLTLKAQRDTINKSYNEVIKDTVVYTITDVMPDFIGGIDSYIKFISSNLKYPVEAAKKGISGTVYVRFVVKKDGSIADVTVLRGVNPLLDNEALRVVSLMPKWKPGMQNGKPVNVYFTTPIKFVLK